MRGLVLPALLTLAACSGSVGAPTHAPTASDIATPTQTQPPTPEPGASDLPIAPATNPPVTLEPTSTAGVVFDEPWAVTELTDVTTGEVFQISDLTAAGKVVFLEPMAIWCGNCRAQQIAAVAALEDLDPATVEWVGLDLETTEDAEALARYSEQNGFPFRYVVADADLSRSLVGQFGDVILSPPSVNVIVLGQDGRITHLLGHHDPAELVAIAREHGA